jgi:hypothetical protein
MAVRAANHFHYHDTEHGTGRRMRLALALLLASRLALADDAPRAVELTPTAHEARVAELACKKDLADCQATDRISAKWLWLGVGAGVVTGFVIGFGAAMAVRR